MINQYPLWKYIAVGLVALLGLIYALPNLYGSDPAIQVSALRGDVSDAVEQQVLERLDQLGLQVKSHERRDGRLLIRMMDEESQFRAKDQIDVELGRGYTVALNLASATPDWLSQINALPMYLGLDLRGGVHFLIQVDMQGALKQADERYASDFRSTLRGERVRYKTILARPEGGVRIVFRDAATLDQAESL
ncbi:MAG: protein translocase subunit SecD, partial [Gammaproteobacteria bacterium]|nr:protein translocase subunit SecD [Gammaproteobacteria bacterium]